jgi:hypothetical protein
VTETHAHDAGSGDCCKQQGSADDGAPSHGGLPGGAPL